MEIWAYDASGTGYGAEPPQFDAGHAGTLDEENLPTPRPALGGELQDQIQADHTGMFHYWVDNLDAPHGA